MIECFNVIFVFLFCVFSYIFQVFVVFDDLVSILLISIEFATVGQVVFSCVEGHGCSIVKVRLKLLQKPLFKDLALVRNFWRLSHDVH